MDISELTIHMHEFVRSKGFYEPNSPRQQSPRNLAISLVLESSEVLEHFQWSDQMPDRQELGLELADVALYLMQIASICDIDLEKAILQKLKINKDRHWT